MFTNKKVFMIGIGGISMSGIAKLLLNSNAIVSGYDARESKITNGLIDAGISVTYEENINDIDDKDIIVYTAAIKEDNILLKYARDNKKEVYERSTFLGMIMCEYENVLCISGTHGKSTTTGMVCTIFLECGLNPTIQIGAILPSINDNVYIGSKNFFIAEACEYVDSFLKFKPTSEIILNIDNDHLDYFHDINNTIASFNKYIHLLPNNGILVVNNDDKNSILASNDYDNKITFGINNNSNYMAKNITTDVNGCSNYDLYINNEKIGPVKLGVKGTHNVYNSLAAIALSYQYIDDIDKIINALGKYSGVQRRFEFIGKYKNTNVYDDYAHHPNEIKTTLESVQNTPHNKSWAVFGPHTYSRTKEHLEEFGKILARFDNVIITPIFAAREKNIYNISENDLIKEINKNGNVNAIYLDNFDKVVNYLMNYVSDNDIIITIGAGNTDVIAKRMVENE